MPYPGIPSACASGPSLKPPPKPSERRYGVWLGVDESTETTCPEGLTRLMARCPLSTTQTVSSEPTAIPLGRWKTELSPLGEAASVDTWPDWIFRMALLRPSAT